MAQIADEPANILEEPVVAPPPDEAAPTDGVLEEELVEDVSIDGMCGVY
jgi:mycofactocin precursor